MNWVTSIWIREPMRGMFLQTTPVPSISTTHLTKLGVNRQLILLLVTKLVPNLKFYILPKLYAMFTKGLEQEGRNGATWGTQILDRKDECLYQWTELNESIQHRKHTLQLWGYRTQANDFLSLILLTKSFKETLVFHCKSKVVILHRSYYEWSGGDIGIIVIYLCCL